ncbi:MAG: tRNA1(Val) (adenine(37)-N6)-methyltransferase [Desulfobacterales bacterium]|jgi:tRNA1Val (adenine37-N6)-methyltransferase
MSESTTDTFFGGQIQVRQPSVGYRFSIDAVLLANMTTVRIRDRVVDLGTGCGIISLILAYRYPKASIQALELQPQLAAFARENVRLNGLERRIAVVVADLRRARAEELHGPFDLAVCNPPYRRGRSGRINPNTQKAIARHEIEARLADVVAASRRLLKRSGRMTVIYPAERTADLLWEMRAGQIEPKSVRTIHSRSGEAAKLVFAEGVYGAGPGLTIEPPLAIYGPDGNYSPEVEAMMQKSP